MILRRTPPKPGPSAPEHGSSDGRNAELLEALMEACGAGVIVIEGPTTVVRANRIAADLFGFAPEELVRRPLIQVTLSAVLVEMVLVAEEPESREVGFLGPQRRTAMASVHRTPDWTLLVLHDITELRRLETMRRDFVANVSHELRTPLASIRAMAETLQDGALEDELVAKRFLGTIVRETDRLSRISEDLLVLSGAELKPPEMSAFDLSELLREVVRTLEPQALSSGLDLSSAIPSGVQISGARDQIEQVFVNLVENAIKYTPTGGCIEVSLCVEAHGSVVRVRDTGIGIMLEHQSRIFERFYRVDKARSRQSGGTGLGLSIVKHIVESHGGKITLDSEFNRGSTFVVLLPITGEPVTTSAIPAE